MQNKNIGTTNIPTDDSTIQAMSDSVDPNKVDEYYFNIEFSHNNKIIKFLTNSLLALDRDDQGNINLYQLMDQLERIDRYKSPLIYIESDLQRALEKSQDDYSEWYANATGVVQKAIIEERMRLKTEEKVPVSMFTGITKDDIKNEIFRTPGFKEAHDKYQNEIGTLKTRISLISKLAKDLERRSFTLIKLLEKHKQDNIFVINEGDKNG